METMALPDLTPLRTRLATNLYAKVAGPNGPETHIRVHHTPGPRWFAEDRPIRQVHGDAAMFVGGLRALLLQSLHPLAMAGVAQHSDYRDDPWGRFQRTTAFLALTTFGTAADAQRAVDRVRGIHRRVHGTTREGEEYRADDPHLLAWVHLAEVDSFLRAHQTYGKTPLTRQQQDDYVTDTARIAKALGVPNPPRTTAELATNLKAYRPELHSTPEAREAARFLVLHPPLPLVVRPPYTVLAATAVALLPAWARLPLRLPYLPLTEATAIRAAGHGLIHGLRWTLST